jgi:hypothetical protein
MFKQNNYGDRQIHHAFYPPGREDTTREELTMVAFLFPVGLIFNCTSRVLMRYSIKTVGLPPMKLNSFLWPAKDNLGLKTAEVYSIP